VAFSTAADAVAGTRFSPPAFNVSTRTLDIPLGGYQATFYYLDTTASSQYASGGGTKPVIQISAPGLFATQLGVNVVRKRTNCDRTRPSLAPPELVVESLMPAQPRPVNDKGDEPSEESEPTVPPGPPTPAAPPAPEEASKSTGG
jgi:hypothetical protein